MEEKTVLQLINDYKYSDEYKNILVAEDYYNGNHDILKRRRTVIGENGALKEINNLPNNKTIDNVFSKLIDQKTNYLLSMPITFKTKDEEYQNILTNFFDRKNHRILKNICEDSLKFGTGYIFINYDNLGNLCLTRFSPLEVVPIFMDDNEEELSSIIRIINQNDDETIIELYEKDYISKYYYKNSKIELFEKSAYFSNGSQFFSFDKLPIIPFKYNSKRIPVIKRVKNLQDSLNKVLSDFQNNMEEDYRNTVLVLQNFDGTNLGEFRKNLSEYGVVKVKTIDGKAGDVKSLKIDVNSENYKTIIDLLKKSIIENGRGFDLKNENTFSSLNKMNIKSLYTDIDLDARGMETEFTASLLNIIWFLNIDLYNKYQKNYENEIIEIIFNKDTIVNESDVIEDCKNSIGILELDQIIKNHPWS